MTGCLFQARSPRRSGSRCNNANARSRSTGGSVVTARRGVRVNSPVSCRGKFQATIAASALGTISPARSAGTQYVFDQTTLPPALNNSTLTFNFRRAVVAGRVRVLALYQAGAAVFRLIRPLCAHGPLVERSVCNRASPLAPPFSSSIVPAHSPMCAPGLRRHRSWSRKPGGQVKTPRPRDRS